MAITEEERAEQRAQMDESFRRLCTASGRRATDSHTAAVGCLYLMSFPESAESDWEDRWFVFHGVEAYREIEGWDGAPCTMVELIRRMEATTARLKAGA